MIPFGKGTSSACSSSGGGGSSGGAGEEGEEGALSVRDTIAMICHKLKIKTGWSEHSAIENDPAQVSFYILIA